jgi:hypothetical protein
MGRYFAATFALQAAEGVHGEFRTFIADYSRRVLAHTRSDADF